ncbi:MAG: KH domain-containing protein [Dehalococcoidia bacterium]|nr:KH domain-containing protein [Dehalococcoidia bacterium]
MAELVDYLARGLVENSDEVRVTETGTPDRVSVRLDVAEGDWGKVIGRQGRVATALRTMVKVAAVQEDCRANLEIGD